MKFFLSYSSVLLFISFSFISAAENQLRVVFNNGLTAPNMNCTASDMTKIMNAIAMPIRQLRSVSEKNEERKLVTFYPPKCKETCKAFATGTCVAPACKGYRRELAAEEERDLYGYDSNALWCDLAISLGDMSLNQLVSFGQVSKNCTNLLKAPRNMTCLTVIC